MSELLTQPGISAVFVASDVVAMGAIQAIKQAGLRIPEDIAVAGFDDIPLARYFDPPLTTVSLPAFGLGWAAGERLIHLIQGDPLDQQDLYLDSKFGSTRNLQSAELYKAFQQGGGLEQGMVFMNCFCDVVKKSQGGLDVW